MNHRDVLWLGGHLAKKSDHITLQQPNHTNPTNTKTIQPLGSHGHFGYRGYYSAHPKRG